MSEKFLELLKRYTPDDFVRAQLVIDSNAMLEIYSIGDLLREVDRLGTPEAALASSTFRWRQLRTRHSTILVWWLAKKRIPIGIHGNEVTDMLTTRLAPVEPKTDTDKVSFGVTKAIVHLVFDFVFTGHQIGPLGEINHEARGTAADTELLSYAQNHGIPIITNENFTENGFSKDQTKLRARAIAAGVKVFTPEEYLRECGVNVEVESRKFIFSLTKAIRAAESKGVLAGDAILEYLDGLYRFILLDEVDERFAHISRPP